MLQTFFLENVQKTHHFTICLEDLHTHTFKFLPLSLFGLDGLLLKANKGFPSQWMRLPTAPFIRWDERCSILFETKKKETAFRHFHELILKPPLFFGEIATFWFVKYLGQRCRHRHTHTHINKQNNGVILGLVRASHLLWLPGLKSDINKMESASTIFEIAFGLHK